MTDPERLYSWHEVRPLLGNIGRATAWRMVRDGRLPAPVRISPGRVAWRHSDIVAWQESQIIGARRWLPPSADIAAAHELISKRYPKILAELAKGPDDQGS